MFALQPARTSLASLPARECPRAFDLPVTPEPHLANGVMDRFVITKRDRHERRSDFPARAFPDGDEDGLSKIAGDLRIPIRLGLLAGLRQHGAQIADRAP